MSARQVGDMDVVAYAGAVDRVVIVAVQRKIVTLACGDLEHDRDEVCLRLMPFAARPGGLKESVHHVR